MKDDLWESNSILPKSEKHQFIDELNDNLQKLEQIPMDEIIEYVLENYYDEMREAIQEQAS
jgi:uncharacterized membrane protein